MASEKGNKSLWLIGCGILAAFLLLFLCIAGIIAAIAIPSYLSTRDKAESSQAETMLRNASMGAEVYRVNNDGSYTGMTASDLTGFTSNLKVVQGSPGTGQVGLSEVTDGSYALTYKGASGKMYKATVTSGSIQFDFKSNPVPSAPLNTPSS